MPSTKWWQLQRKLLGPVDALLPPPAPWRLENAERHKKCSLKATIIPNNGKAEMATLLPSVFPPENKELMDTIV